MIIIISSHKIHDEREYSCNGICDKKMSIRYNSFTDEFKCTIMELLRIIFYYYCRGYSVETVHKEMAYGISRCGGIDMSK